MPEVNFLIPVGNTGVNFNATAGGSCQGEEYKTNPVITFSYQAHSVYGWFMASMSRMVNGISQSLPQQYEGRGAISLEKIVNESVRVWGDPSLTSYYWCDFSEEYGQSMNSYGDISYTTQVAQVLPQGVLRFDDYRIDSIVEFSFHTNIPIFETDAEAETYIRLGTGITSAINYETPTMLGGKHFEITNIWEHGTWNQYGPHPDGPRNYRCVRGTITNEGGTISFYKIPGVVDGSLKYGIHSSAQFEALEYTTDGVTWHDTSYFPFEFFYRPFESGDPFGTYNYGLTCDSMFPEWDNEQDSNDYINGEKDVNEAPNYPLISGNYPTENNTGDSDDETEFGDVYTKSFFTNQYICSEAVIQQIANDLFDVTPGGIWEDIKKGLDMFGQNPMDAVVSLMYYPVDLYQVFTSISADPYIFFGGYQLQLSDGKTAGKILYPNGYFDIGGVTIQRTFHSWRDLPPYTRMWVDLPYCGKYELDPTLYYDKELTVRYFIDTHTGGCCCALLADDHCYDQFNGQLGTQLPITLTDFSAYANAQINTLLGNGGQAVNTGLSVGTNASGALAGSGAALGVASASVAAGALGAIQGAKTVYGLAQNNINKFNKTRGGSSAMLNQYLNQKVTITFETMELDIPDNFYQLNGAPSNKGGVVGNFAGYFEADQIKLRMPGATQSEKEKARALLMGGVYI